MNIRQYRADDVGTVRYICIATATGKRYRKNSALVTALYCDYYIKCEPENCFVLTDEFDKPVGYILCSANDTQYQREFEPYFKAAKKLSLIEAIGHRAETAMTAAERQAYTAHMHIDILPSFQGKGGGKALVQTLTAHLKRQGVNGLRLSVGVSNKGAVAFYERLGFKRVKTLGRFCYVYAMKV